MKGRGGKHEPDKKENIGMGLEDADIVENVSYCVCVWLRTLLCFFVVRDGQNKSTSRAGSSSEASRVVQSFGPPGYICYLFFAMLLENNHCSWLPRSRGAREFFLGL